MGARPVLAALSCLALTLLAACGSMGGTGGAGGQGTGGETGSGATGGGSATSTSSSGSTDPLEAARVECVDKINALRATKALPPLERWKDAEACVDQEASEDAQTGMAHGAWLSGKYACNGGGQNECPSWGVSGISGCLDQMWAEKDQAGCAGCDACAGGYNPSCPGCDFYGTTTGNVCGHYVNLSATYHTKVACGFSATGGWDAINFQ
jgi:hypothetical protein